MNIYIYILYNICMYVYIYIYIYIYMCVTYICTNLIHIHESKGEAQYVCLFDVKR